MQNFQRRLTKRPAPRVARSSLGAMALASLATFAVAQPHIVAGQVQRQMAQVSFDGDVAPHGRIAIDYGSPVWREEYSARLVDGEDLYLRLGHDFWATLNTNLHLQIGGVDVAPGFWYLGLNRTAAGDWMLTLLDAAKANELNLRPGQRRFPPVDIRAPLELATAETATEQMSIWFEVGDVGECMLRMGWSTFALSAQVMTPVKGVEPVAGRPFAIPGDQALTTVSGLRYEILTEGAGEHPGATDTVAVRYTGWTAEGKLFDTSRDESMSLPLERVIQGWREGVQLMRPGGEILLLIPSELAYGSSGAGTRIAPDTDLVFWIELVKVE